MLFEKKVNNLSHECTVYNIFLPFCSFTEMMPQECAVSLEDRVECGFFGIERDQCLKKLCCWQPYGVDSEEPWCFHKSKYTSIYMHVVLRRMEILLSLTLSSSYIMAI